MKDAKKHDQQLLEHLFDFLFPSDEMMTRAEVQEELRQRKIDVEPVVEKIAVALNKARERERAKAALEAARERRPTVMDAIQNTVAGSVGLARESIEKLLKKKLAGAGQAVYMRRLESASSDEDLRSILDDLAKIEKLPEESDHGQP